MSRFVRRFRMEIDLRGIDVPEPEVRPGYHCLPWHPDLLDRHAWVKYRSFCDEIDSRVFRCLGRISGCRRLMAEIVGQESFVPGATWLICYRPGECVKPIDCGTIQGVGRAGGLGAIQNVGVVPEHRGLGLGRALMLKALRGFQDAGLDRVYLEVTASNQPAVHLYRSLGFRLTRTMYKPLEADPAEVY